MGELHGSKYPTTANTIISCHESSLLTLQYLMIQSILRIGLLSMSNYWFILHLVYPPYQCFYMYSPYMSKPLNTRFNHCFYNGGYFDFQFIDTILNLVLYNYYPFATLSSLQHLVYFLVGSSLFYIHFTQHRWLNYTQF